MKRLKDQIHILFIVNPFSGVGKQKAIEKHLEKNLDQTKFCYDVSYTEAPNHATKLCREGIDATYDLIVAVGGDGTVNEVALPLIGKNIPLGIIPSGSGNGLARHLKIPMEPDKAIQVLARMERKKIDTVEVNGRFFLSIAGVGFDSFVAKKFAGQKRRGFLKYAEITLGEYQNYKPKEFTLVVDGKPKKRKALFISFANSDQFGYNTSISPNAIIDDGMVDICIMKKFPLWKSIFMAPLLFLGKIDRSPYIEIIRASQVEIQQKQEHFNLDGESVDMGKNLHIHVVPKSLEVIVP